MMKKAHFGLVIIEMCACSVLAHTVRYSIHVTDAATGNPVENVPCETIFTTHTGNWNDMSKGTLKRGLTNANGDISFEGDSDENHITYSLKIEDGNFYPITRKQLLFDHVSGAISKRWEPYDSVVTVALQRIEHPIPLFVKHVELRDNKNGIGCFDGTNSVLRFDLMKGEWLPPYGNGEVADLPIDSKLTITDRERKFRYATKKVEDVLFYELSNTIDFGGQDDFVRQFDAGKMAGIKIREATDFNPGNRVVKAMGMRKIIAKNKNWHCEYYSDKNADRCYTFRIRSRRNEKGELVEAYYGKIYGDFEFEGDDKKGLIGVKFLYYLNPTSLARNLEWDMKHNHCSSPGNVGAFQP